ncbi:hypothetical protein M8J77_021025 [Diaphorina citri]|nr:hypothetical protein M8J77_021025 [Diaphorina citri]
MSEIQKRVENQIGRENMNIMLFADDIFVWGKNQNELQTQIDKWTDIAAEYGLQFSAGKSEIVVLKSEEPVEGDIVMSGTTLKKVDHFKYLGSIISEDSPINKEMDRRIQQGSAFYNKVKDLIWSSYVPLKCKRTLFQTYFVPIITYASETWVMKGKDESRLQAAEMRFVRSMLGKTRRDRIRNEVCRNLAGVEKVQERIERTRLKWYGHMQRMENVSIPKQMFNLELNGRRRRGRPRLRWKDMINRDISKRGQNPNTINIHRKYNDRIWWRGFVHSRPVPLDGTT